MAKAADPPDFGPLFQWLGKHHDDVEGEYGRLQKALTSYFHDVRHCGADSEELTDRTIKRCADLLLKPAKPGRRSAWEKKPASYAHSVARYIYREYWKKVRTTPLDREVSDPRWEEPERKLREEDVRRCSDEALQRLPEAKRALITRYCSVTPETKAQLHAELAAELGIDDGALRARIFRIRATLHELVKRCLDE